jgi:hypothetical protein
VTVTRRVDNLKTEMWRRQNPPFVVFQHKLTDILSSCTGFSLETEPDSLPPLGQFSRLELPFSLPQRATIT